MVPAERERALAAGEAFDRLPCTLSLGEFKAPLLGVNFSDLVRDEETMVRAEIHAFNRFGADSISMGANSYGIAEAMGANVCYPENKLPYIAAPVLTDYSMLDDMRPMEPMKDGRVSLYMKACKALAERAEGIVELHSSVGGPFTIASYLRGTENLMRDVHRHPAEVRRLLKLVTQSMKRCVDAFAPWNVRIAMADPVASGNMISPQAFREFVFPCLKEVMDYAFRQTGKKVTFHLCGKTERIWPDLLKLKMERFSVDERIDLAGARSFLGGAMKIAGNVPPVEVLLNGKREDIFQAVKGCVDLCAGSPGGFILAPGCQVSPATPAGNLDDYMEAARVYCGYDYVKQYL